MACLRKFLCKQFTVTSNGTVKNIDLHSSFQLLFFFLFVFLRESDTSLSNFIHLSKNLIRFCEENSLSDIILTDSFGM